MSTIKAMVRNRRIEVPAPSEIPDGAEVTLTITESHDDRPLMSAEIAGLLAEMQKLGPWEIPDAVAADLEDWERKINQRGIDQGDASVGDVL